VHIDEAVPVGDGQPLQQRGVDQAEDRGVRADAEREREDGRDGKSRLFAQHPRRVAYVVPEIREQAPPVHSRSDRRRQLCLTKRSHVPRERVGLEQLFDRQTKRAVLTLAVGAQLVEPLVEMLRELFDDFGLPGRAQAERREARAQVLGPVRHDRLR